ncbi:MAG: glycosyltransferase family 39 protein [Solirubrobacterales bacterium]
MAGLTVLALALRLNRFGQPFLGDEISTLYIVRNDDLAGTVSALASDREISPPLYFLTAWLFSKLGSAPELIRVPSLIAGTLSIPLVYALGARAVSRTAGMLAAAVMTLMPFMIFYSGDGRTYAMAIALLLASTLSMLAAVRTGRRRWWVAYGVLTALAMYTHYTAAFVLAAQLLWLLWAHPRVWKPAVLANVGAVVLYAPWIPSMRADFDSPTIDILSALQGDGFAIKRLAVETWSMGYPYVLPKEVPGRAAMVMIAGALAVAAVAALVRWYRKRDESRRLPPVSRGVVLVFAIALATPVAEVLILIVTGNDLFGARNLSTSSAGLALAIGTTLASAGPLVGVVTAVIVLAGFSVGTARTFRDGSDALRFDLAAEFIAAESRPGDVVIDAISAATTPVPLTPLDIHLDDKPPTTNLFFPQGDPPFLPFKSDPLPPTPELERAFSEAAPDGRVFLITTDSPVTVAPPGGEPAVDNTDPKETSFVLPPGSRIVDRVEYPGVVPLDVLVVEPGRGPTGGSE